MPSIKSLLAKTRERLIGKIESVASTTLFVVQVGERLIPCYNQSGQWLGIGDVVILAEGDRGYQIIRKTVFGDEAVEDVQLDA